MRIRIGGSDWYDFDGSKLLVKEARELQKLTGMGLQGFSDGIKEGNVDALVFMLYVAKRRAGEAARWADFDELDIASLEVEADEDELAAAAAAQGGEDASTEEDAGDPPDEAAAPAKRRKATPRKRTAVG